MEDLVTFIPSEQTLGSLFRIKTNALITDIHKSLNTYLSELPNVKYVYSELDKMYRVVVYRNGLVDERFHIQVCCVQPKPNIDMFMYTHPTLYIVFTSEIHSKYDEYYNVYKGLEISL